MMQLGLRLHDAEDLPIEERLARVKEQGFTCTHMALSKISDLSASVSSLTPGYAMHLKDLYAKAGLDCAVLGCYKNLANPDAKEMAAILEEYKASIRFAAILGAGVVGTETGAPNRKYSTDAPGDREASRSEEALNVFISNLRVAVEYAEKMGVILAIEPVYRHIVWNPKRARKVLDAIESPNLQIIFDPVNLLDPDEVRKSPSYREEILGEAMDLLGSDIAVIHLKDYKIEEAKEGPAQQVCMGCGLGEMDYTSVLKFALEKKPFIHATLENTKPENAAQCRAFIEELEHSILGEKRA